MRARIRQSASSSLNITPGPALIHCLMHAQAAFSATGRGRLPMRFWMAYVFGGKAFSASSRFFRDTPMAQMRGGARLARRGKTSSLPWRRSARFRRIASKNARANLARFEDGSGFGDAHCSASAPLIGALKRLAHGMLLLSWTGAEIERRECAKLDAGRATIPHKVESYRRAWRPGRRVRSSRIAHVWPKPVPRLDIFEALGPRVSARTRRQCIQEIAVHQNIEEAICAGDRRHDC